MSAIAGSAMASLRLATRDAHELIDRDLGRGDWLSSPGAYATFLARNLRFHRLVETAVAPAAPSIEGSQYRSRPRSPLLVTDLSALAREGVVPDVRAGRRGAPARLVITGPGSALGCLYVVEGSSLGGRVLARWIATRLGYDRHRGASGFAADARGTAQRWRAFGAFVEAWIASTPEDLNSMLDSAQATFAAHRAVVVNPLPFTQAQSP